ncbi:hypothetical protein B0F90DRAFT_1637318 [Multifurca ochricompacta]|uniref:DUF218 domain-containing protein n=1 Tax=Multifurca ochricompacta TaxID=376703 RepID=A0AAD4QIJ4_9AGAM|nr:hypothetical protein B0F90DRAFT_1637318 [Multifurca ochricompacta]
MLPLPASSYQRHRIHPQPSRSLSKLLRTPARLTNFAVFLLLTLLVFSVFLNLRYIYTPTTRYQHVFPPRSIIDTLPATLKVGLDHLVIVPGHSIWTGSRPEDAEVEESWILASYQKGRRRPSIFRAHISRGSQIAIEDPRALLVFSGGYTSLLSATSEAESYLRFARVTGLIPPSDSFTRVTTEDAALDSFQNVLFSIARFREITGAYPHRITVVGHDFKRRRFEQLHRLALRWPNLHFTYDGIPLHNEADEREGTAGELANAFNPYSTDLYGCHAPLVQKRAGRNFHARTHGYHVGAPELRELLEWCPRDGTQIFSGALPWAK